MATQRDTEIPQASPFVRDGKVVRGKDGWLFIGHDASRTLEQQSGELLLAEDQLRDWRLLLETRTAWLERQGIHYQFTIVPDAHAVYPEKLPDQWRHVHRRPVTQLISHLDESGSFARVLYPLPDLLEKKKEILVYSKTDSHWTSIGAFTVYQVLMDELAPHVPARRLTADDVSFEELDFSGDLGAKFDPVESAPQLIGHVNDDVRSGGITFDNLISNRGRRMEWLCHAAPDSTCLLLGDSFFGGIVAFLSQSFRRLVFANIPRLDFELVAEVKPDVVLSMMAERFIINVPYDLPRFSNAMMVERKLSQGEVLDERAYEIAGREPPGETTGEAAGEAGTSSPT